MSASGWDRASLGADMLEWLLDNFWLSMYILLSQAFVANFAARQGRSLGLLACIFMLIFAPTWPLFFLFFLFKGR